MRSCSVFNGGDAEDAPNNRHFRSGENIGFHHLLGVTELSLNALLSIIRR